MREVVEYTIGDARLVGTRHGDRRREESTGAAKSGLGVLLVNFALASRAGIGDLSAWIADRVSEHGYPVFRFDFPGLGDARGPAPEFGEPLWQFIRDGGHAGHAATLVRRLRQDHGLQGVILGGLCAGAVTTLYAAADCGVTVPGVFLLEPIFHMCTERPGKDPLRRRRDAPAAWRGRLPRIKKRIYERLSQTPPDHWTRRLYVTGKKLRDGMRGRRLPSDANRPLLAAWRAVAGSETRVLLVNSGVEGRVMHNLYYLGLRFHKHADWRVVPETNHLMAAHGGKEAVARHVTTWLGENFTRPRARHRSSASRSEMRASPRPSARG